MWYGRDRSFFFLFAYNALPHSSSREKIQFIKLIWNNEVVVVKPHSPHDKQPTNIYLLIIVLGPWLVEHFPERRMYTCALRGEQSKINNCEGIARVHNHYLWRLLCVIGFNQLSLWLWKITHKHWSTGLSHTHVMFRHTAPHTNVLLIHTHTTPPPLHRHMKTNYACHWGCVMRSWSELVEHGGPHHVGAEQTFPL